MNFIAPLFLLGALAVALPVIFHLIRRSVKERKRFSSLMFLVPSPPRLTRRSRIEHWLLLALRCLVLCLLAFGFARPFLKKAFPQAQALGGTKKVMVLIDTSASMRRQDLWKEARAKADEIARRSENDSVAMFTFDRQLRTLVSFDEWERTAAGERAALARSRLTGVQPGWAGTGLDSALTEAAELFGDAPKDDRVGRCQIVVISDFQEGSRLTALQGHDWPKGLQVTEERLTTRPANNASVRLLTDIAAETASTETAIRIQVNNASDSKAEQFRVGWASTGNAGKPLDVYVPAGQSRVVSVPNPGTNMARIVLTGDDEPFDNAVWVIPPERSEITVVYLGNDADADARQPLFFLRGALQDTPRQTVRLQRAASAMTLAQVNAATLFVVSTVLEDSQADLLKEAVAGGKTALMVPTSAEAAAGVGKVLGLELPQVSEHKPGGYAMLAHVAFEHPLFAPFADSRFSDFTKIHFWSYRKMDFTSVPKAEVLARFDTGDAAIIAVPSGKGRVFVFTSGWHPPDSQLGLSSKFVPLLYSLVELSCAAPPAPQQYVVGSTLPITPAAVGPVTLDLPTGSKLRLNAGETNYVATEPGVYIAAGPAATARLAVNLDPGESRTAPMAQDELERLGIPGLASTVALQEGEKKMRMQNAELEARQKLWRWLIVVALAVLLIETWIAGRTARKATMQTEVA